jgi:transcriptional regulator with XRE-family HTH domain
MRELRQQRGVTLKDMAAALRVSPAYLSALEHGKRGRPSWHLVQGIIAYFNVIWDDAENLVQLARVSHPRIVTDTAGLDPRATELANRLSANIHKLDQATVEKLLALLDEA